VICKLRIIVILFFEKFDTLIIKWASPRPQGPVPSQHIVSKFRIPIPCAGYSDGIP
jgi:hypothetical protein